MCCTGSLVSRRATSSQNLGSKSASGTRCSLLLLTPCRYAASSSASARGDSTPASARRVTATPISDISKLCLPRSPPVMSAGPLSLRGGHLVGPVGLDQRGDDRVEVSVEDLVQVVGLVSDSVVRYPV